MTSSPFLLFLIILKGFVLICQTSDRNSSSSEVKYQPLFLFKNEKTYELVVDMTYDSIDNEYSVFAPQNHNIYYACNIVDLRNFIQYSNTLETHAIGSSITTTTKDHCARSVKPTILKVKPNKIEANTSEYRIGFLIHDKEIITSLSATKYENLLHHHQMIPVLSIKYDAKLSRTISVEHTINAGHLLEVISIEPETQYDANSQILGIRNIDELYSQNSQDITFKEIFFNYHFMYFSFPLYALKKVQLAPWQDFVLPNLAKTTFMDLNTAPIWNIEWKQWQNVEIFVRKVAQVLGTLNVETGTTEILRIKNPDSPKWRTTEFVDMYLSVNSETKIKKFPIPKYIYKAITYAVYEEGETSTISIKGVLIIMLNSPYDDIEKPDKICDDISIKLGWLISNDDRKTGQTYVCVLNEANMQKLGLSWKNNYEEFNLHDIKSPKDHKISVYQVISASEMIAATVIE